MPQEGRKEGPIANCFGDTHESVMINKSIGHARGDHAKHHGGGWRKERKEGKEQMNEKSEIRPAWDLFHRCFSEGDEVLVICLNDKWDWGHLRLNVANRDEEFVLMPSLGSAGHYGRIHRWDTIRAMFRDGFPCRKLLGADGSAFIERIATETLTKHIKEFLVAEQNESGLYSPSRI